MNENFVWNSMNVERLEEPDIFRNGWFKILLCFGLLGIALVFPLVTTAVLYSLVLAGSFKIWAIIYGIALMFFLLPVAVWVVFRWGFSLTSAEARYWIKRKISRPLILINIPLQLFLVGLMFYMLWMLLD